MYKNIAAIDIGTNSFHLIVAKVLDDGGFDIIDREKEVIRLSEGTVGDIKLISSEAMDRGIKALKNMKGIADSHNAEVFAAATSALRESLNKEEFIEKVFAQTGIKINLVSGEEEARLIYSGVLRALPIYDKQVLCIDIGGGSTEFTIGKKGKVLYSKSVKLGAVRLSQMFFPDNVLNDENIKACKDWVRGTFYPISKEIKKIGYESIIGSSGTIMSVGLMVAAERNEAVPATHILNNYEIKRKEIEKVEEKILSLKTHDKRKKIKGLDERRADIIPAGIIIFSEIVKCLKIDSIRISGYALREGIIADVISRNILKTSVMNFDVRKESIEQMSNKFLFDSSHCNHVALLSEKLFDLTKPIHKLEEEKKEYLVAASKLHDIGYHISHDQHHKHSLYIIKNHGLLGYSNEEIKIIANIARYHRKSHPKKNHSDFTTLLPEDQQLVKKLAALLRVTDSLDRLHSGNIADLDLQIENGNAIFFIYYKKHFPEIELWNLERRKILFEEVFDVKLISVAKKE